MRRSLVHLVASRTLATALQVLSLVLLARATSPSTFGPVSAVVGVGAFLSALVDMGMSTFLLQVRARDPRSPVIRSALRLNNATSVLLLALVVGVALSLHLALGPGVMLAAWVCLEKNADTRLSLAIADERVAPVAVVFVARRALALGLYLPLTHVTGQVTAFALAQVCGALYAGVHSRLLVRDSVSAERVPLREVVAGSRHYWLAVLSAQVRELDTALVGAAAGVAVGGLYGFGSRLSRPANLVAASLAMVMLPAAPRGGPRVARRTGLHLVVLAGISLALGLAAGPLVPRLLAATGGAAYGGAGPATRVLVAFMGVSALCSPLASLLQSQGESRFVARSGLLLAALLAAALYVGAEREGAVGAALGLAGVYTAKFCVLALRLRSTTAAADPGQPALDRPAPTAAGVARS